MSEDSLFLGVDGGQTASRGVLVARDGRVVADAEAGRMTHAVAPEGVDLMRQALRDIAAQTAGYGRPEAVFMGLCAVTSGTRSQQLGELVAAEIWPDSLRGVEGDGVAAWAAGTGAHPGVAVVAGTGSVVEAINARGEVAETGAWGHLFGDWGSGWHMGSSAVRAVLRRWDQTLQISPLGRAVLDALKVEAPIEILFTVYGGGADPVPVAKLSEVVSRLAKEGDEEAIEIQKTCARSLAEDVANATGRLDWDSEPIPVATLGRAFLSGPLYREAFRAAVESACSVRVRVVSPVLSILGGDALLALRLGSVGSTDDLIAALVAGGLGPS